MEHSWHRALSTSIGAVPLKTSLDEEFYDPLDEYTEYINFKSSGSVSRLQEKVIDLAMQGVELNRSISM